MTVGGLVDTVFRFNRLCECHLYTAPRNISYDSSCFRLRENGMAIPMEQKPADEKDMAQRVDQFDAIVIGAGVTGLY